LYLLNHFSAEALTTGRLRDMSGPNETNP